MILPQHGSIITKAKSPPSAREIISHRRARWGWSQGDLARRAGIPRTTVSAIEGARLTPSVSAALAVARALECTVEELFGTGVEAVGERSPSWAWPPREEPSRYWEAEVGGRRLIYPTESLSLNPVPHDGVFREGVAGEAGADLAATTLTLACCDPAAGLLAAEYARSSGFRLIVFSRSSREALELLKQNRIHLAGIHLSTSENPLRNTQTAESVLGRGYQLVRVAQWQEGLGVATSNKTRSALTIVKTARQLALREAGSSARECLDELCENASLRGRTVRSHAAVAEAVQAGWADAGICLKLCADEAGLNFLPVRTEAFDLCFPSALKRDARIVALLRLLRSRSHRRLLSDLPGYDGRAAGEFVSG